MGILKENLSFVSIRSIKLHVELPKHSWHFVGNNTIHRKVPCVCVCVFFNPTNCKCPQNVINNKPQKASHQLIKEFPQGNRLQTGIAPVR